MFLFADTVAQPNSAKSSIAGWSTKLFGVVAWAHRRATDLPFVYTLSGKGAERWVPLSGSNKSTFTSGKLVRLPQCADAHRPNSNLRCHI
jgi:hypothetical protein